MEALELEEHFIDDYLAAAAVQPEIVYEPGVESMTFVTKYLPIVQIVEAKGQIHITGIPAGVISQDIHRMWDTSRINKFMFTKIGTRELKFPSFFAIEVRFMLQTLLDERKVRHVHAVKAIISELNDKTWLKGIDEPTTCDFDFDQLRRLNVSMLPSQMDYLHEYNNNVRRYNLKGYLLAAPPGSGKTISGYGLSVVSNVEQTIVICPKNAVDEVWRTTLQIRFKEVPRFWCSSMKTPPDPRAEYFIFHYEQIGAAVEFFKTQPTKRRAVLLDESHNLNEMTAARTLRFIELCLVTKAEHIEWASGTPMKAMGAEMVPFLSTIDPLFTEDVAKRFVQIFGKSVARAVDIIAHRMGLVTFKVPKADVVKTEVDDYPVSVKFKGGEAFTLDKIRDEIKAYVTERMAFYKQHRAEYVAQYDECINYYRARINSSAERAALNDYLSDVQHLAKHFDPYADKDIVIACSKFEEQRIIPVLPFDLRRQFRDSRSVVKYVILKVRGEALGRILTKRRIECFCAMVPHSPLDTLIEASEKKTLIFASNVEVVKRIGEDLTSKGYKPLLVYGETNKDLSGIMRRFREDPQANPMIATYDSLSTAVPVIEANTVILFNTPFRDYERNQATSRVNRYGQDSPVHIRTILLDTGSEGNISTRSNEIMEWSKEQVDAIMGIDTSVDKLSVTD